MNDLTPRLLAALRSAPAGARTADLAARIGADPAEVAAALCRLAGAKQVRCWGALWFVR